MLAIRMRRVGAKKARSSVWWWPIIARRATARLSRFSGTTTRETKPEKLELDRERVDYWLSKGARPSDTVRTLIARQPAPPAPVAAE